MVEVKQVSCYAYMLSKVRSPYSRSEVWFIVWTQLCVSCETLSPCLSSMPLWPQVKELYRQQQSTYCKCTHASHRLQLNMYTRVVILFLINLFCFKNIIFIANWNEKILTIWQLLILLSFHPKTFRGYYIGALYVGNRMIVLAAENT